MDDKPDEIEIVLSIPDELLDVTSAADILDTVTIAFNDRTFPLRAVLHACMPLLDAIEANADAIRADLLIGRAQADLTRIDEDL